MIKNSTTIKLFILEDDKKLASDMLEFFRRRNFEVLHAASSAEMFEVLKGVVDLDVALLDNRLGNETVSGSERARDLREDLFRFNPPECLVYSGEDGHDYYQQAIRAGAADYLRKGNKGLNELAVPLRVLALCKALRWERQPKVLRKLRRIAAEATHRDAALVDAVKQVLLPELQRVMAGPFHLVMSTLDRTFCLSDKGYGFEGADVSRVLDLAEPKKIVPLPTDLLPVGRDWPEVVDCHLVQLYERGPFKLALNLPTVARDGAYLYPDNGRAMAEALLLYLQPVFFRSLENLVELMANADEAYLQGLVSSCSTQSGRLESIYADLQHPDHFHKGMSRFKQFLAVLERRGSEGEFLLQEQEKVHDIQWDVRRAVSDEGQNTVRQMLEQAWKLSMEDLPEAQLSWKGENFTWHNKVLWQCAKRIFSWMAQRGRAQGEAPRVTVTSEIKYQARTLAFHDVNAGKCSQWERNALFDPYSSTCDLPFYELREAVKQLGGSLEDESDDVSGHRFVISLPLYSEQFRGAGMAASA